MTPEIQNELNRKEGPKELCQALLDYARARVKRSRGKMSQYYSDWDLQDQVYRGERMFDEDDVEQERKGKPTKMIVPNTFAQVESFSAFLFMMFNQNRTLFELQPTGDEDHGTKHKDMEQVLERDFRRNEKNKLLYQHLTDVGRFGPGIFSCEWVRHVTRAKFAAPPTVVNMNGVTLESRSDSEWHDVVKYEGNEIRNVSPYRWFPDTGFPLSDFNKGNFCAYEEEYTMADLRTMAEAGEVAGIDNIQPLPASWATERGAPTRTIADFTSTRGASGGYVACGSSEHEGPVLVTKCRMWLVPSKFEYQGGDKKLGPEEHKVLYHLWYANDNTLIRCEPAEEWHGSFGMTLSQFTPDMHHTVNLGLANLVYRLQDVMSWFINSHIKSVRRTIANRLVVNLDAVEPRSLDGEGDIYLKKGFGRRNWQEAVGQLQVSDVTGGHMADSQLLNGLMQMVTGVNDNAMGQYNGGRRSAQEARVVTAGAAGRMKMHGHLIWETGLAPLGQMMLSNSRQSLSPEEFAKVIGSAAADPARFAAFQGTPEEVIGGDDYFVFDSTLASEKGFMAQSLQELLSTILTVNPAAAMAIAQRIDPVKMVDEIQYLRGGGNVSRFNYAPGQGLPMPPPQLINNPPAASA